MNITPLGNTIQLDIKEATAGALDTSSRDSAVEYAEVIAIPQEVVYKTASVGMSTTDNIKRLNQLKVGDKVFVKAWAIDIVSHEDKKYYFCNLDTNGVLAIVK